MSRKCLILCAVFAMSASTAFGQDHWFARWNDHCRVVSDRNNFWPQPFIEADRQAVDDPFRTMVENGWKRQHLMSAHHFDAGELNEAGRIKAQRLISQTPPRRHSIFVQRSLDPKETHDRLAAVQSWANKVSRGQPVTVVASDMAPRASSGDRLDMINRKHTDTIPNPRIPSSGGSLTGA
ncbi:MAG: hypothetical protein N2B03_05515 [Boseongicola sp.]